MVPNNSDEDYSICTFYFCYLKMGQEINSLQSKEIVLANNKLASMFIFDFAAFTTEKNVIV